MWVEERATQSPGPRSVAKSFLYVGDVVMWNEDTSRAGAQVVEPLVGDMRMTEVFDPRDLLPDTFAAKRVSHMAETSPIRQP